MRRESMSVNMDSMASVPSVVAQYGEHYDFLAKAIMVGPSGAGKSCILHRFIRRDYDVLASQTVGVEFASKVVCTGDSSNNSAGGGAVKLQLWDTAGQERFRSLTRSYYRSAAGVILVYDLSNPRSLDALWDFVEDTCALAAGAVVVVAGNKSDRQQAVGSEELQKFLTQCETLLSEKVVHVVVSALTGSNVDSIFETLARSILAKVDAGELDPEDPASGVQYGDVPNWNTASATLNSERGESGRRFVGRKRTTLSLVDRSLMGNSSRSSYSCSC